MGQYIRYFTNYGIAIDRTVKSRRLYLLAQMFKFTALSTDGGEKY